ncbi:hypothetical protein [Actinoallomurus sp. NPDC050550]|uniref:hypothetical protein n=1 Tax=Actinoallomurus sp. NPDC050550 TaxID=3154937 RepID=UPI0034097794
MDHSLGALVELCRELAGRGIRVGISDARPALSARVDVADRRLWIEVDASGESFVWRRDDHDHHRTDDPVGAAVA